MRHVPIDSLLRTIFDDPEGKKDKRSLDRANRTVSGKPAADRKAYIDKNGAAKWKPLKDRITAELGNKCWYTEAEVVGAHLAIDHYRPKCDYWFLAFKPENYRVACPFANSPMHNEEHGCAGGKGEKFPLLDESKRAADIQSVGHERPIILDPCNEEDCKLLVFQSDGRPRLHPDFEDDAAAVLRVNESKLLLNLDHPDFNSKREILKQEIADAILDHEAFAEDSPRREEKRKWLSDRISLAAPFSMAARQYLSDYRYLKWVAEILG